MTCASCQVADEVARSEEQVARMAELVATVAPGRWISSGEMMVSDGKSPWPWPIFIQISEFLLIYPENTLHLEEVLQNHQE